MDCVYGFVQGGSGRTCAFRCNGNCCTGDLACDGFTGKVCQDGSCNGEASCFYANASGVLVNSCNGDMACIWAGRNGKVGNVIDSCDGPNSCDSIGAHAGGVANIQDSCNAPDACYFAGRFRPYNITSNMNNCCNKENECKSKSEATLPPECKVRLMTCLSASSIPPELLSHSLLFLLVHTIFELII